MDNAIQLIYVWNIFRVRNLIWSNERERKKIILFKKSFHKGGERIFWDKFHKYSNLFRIKIITIYMSNSYKKLYYFAIK